jgi:hypothetical protein
MKLSFLRVFLAWGSISAGISVLCPLLVFGVGSLSSALTFLVWGIFSGAVVALSGAWILINSRPRELRSRKRFGRVLGFFLPILLFFVVPFFLGWLGILSGIFSFVILVFLGSFPFTIFLIAGSILGGDWAAQCMEGRPLQNLIASIFQRG